MPVDRFPVEAGHIMMFARAVGDPNPVYSDEAYARSTEAAGVIAPPTFVAAAAQFDPDYVMRPRIGEPWMGSGRTPTGWADRPSRTGGGTGLHAEQHYEYVRPLRPGDVLTARSHNGQEWTKQGRRGGRLVFRELVTEYFDPEDRLVLRARSVVVRTEHPVEKEG
ncbi:FAS1-like dehydratase domain-containing protein [Paractinoplanes globisporus]|uniref:MaoC family dehydratase N-terminal domain-containing protein n=1 Tax=Paractinoplanes globisporus TaxID=113565 RepID=A0ABW6WAQ1_9ACTN|nr:MaoC family dehydratase N-terminal domain-containing protein [Actinoplanes globisporus]